MDIRNNRNASETNKQKSTVWEKKAFYLFIVTARYVSPPNAFPPSAPLAVPPAGGAGPGAAGTPAPSLGGVAAPNPAPAAVPAAPHLGRRRPAPSSLPRPAPLISPREGPGGGRPGRLSPRPSPRRVPIHPSPFLCAPSRPPLGPAAPPPSPPRGTPPARQRGGPFPPQPWLPRGWTNAPRCSPRPAPAMSPPPRRPICRTAAPEWMELRFNTLAKCPHCKKISSVGSALPRRRCCAYITIGMICIFIGVGLTVGTQDFARRFHATYVSWAIAYLLGLICLIRACYWGAIKVSYPEHSFA
uniref:Phosphatidylinositol-4,5-bisphosphate 4-phosphatase n=1 Tax=Phasianus colchicus TaxID=9054 RepID=A0A669P396_PHACC